MYIQQVLRNLDKACIQLNIKKAQKLLGWRPETSLDNGMKVSKIWANDQGLL